MTPQYAPLWWLRILWLSAIIGSVSLSCNGQTFLSEEVTPSLLDERAEAEKVVRDNPYVLSQHRFNYLLPVTYVSNPSAFGNADITPESVENEEAKFQISVKTPLYLQEDSLDGVYFGFTLTSFWQILNSDISKPFRETNYEPEVFYQKNVNLNLLSYRFNLLQVGVNHMSNGQSGLLSRSWNRVFATALFSTEDALYYVKSWYRIPEQEKAFPEDPRGDDNPDITDFFGRIELGYGRKWEKFGVLAVLRNNLNAKNNRGSLQVDLTYPLSARYNLMLQYFNGYGDSLIDYDRYQQRIGLGVQLAFY